MPNYRVMLRQSVKYSVDVTADNEEDAGEMAREYLCDADKKTLDFCECDATDFQTYATWDNPPNFKADVVAEEDHDEE
jgi:hypothetical protein